MYRICRRSLYSESGKWGWADGFANYIRCTHKALIKMGVLQSLLSGFWKVETKTASLSGLGFNLVAD